MIAWLKWLWQGATRGERIGMVAALAFAIWTVGLFSFVSWQLLQEEPLKRSVRCGRCGAVWETESGSDAAIAECPLCPMSEAEFEALQLKLRSP